MALEVAQRVHCHDDKSSGLPGAAMEEGDDDDKDDVEDEEEAAPFRRLRLPAAEPLLHIALPTL